MSDPNIESSARLIQHGDVAWAVGGHWGAGGQVERKPKSWAALAKDEFFPPDRTAYAWSKELQQVGWFVWPTRKDIPKNAKPLALQAAAQVPIQKHPFVAVFNLGEDLWWLFGTDGAGAVHPQWGDIAGTLDEVEHHINAYGAAIASSTAFERFSTPEESWGWLLADETEEIPLLRPVAGGLASPRAKVTLAVVVVAAVALSVGGVMYRQQQGRLQAEAAAQLQAAQERAMEQLRLDHAKKEAEMMRRIQAQWDAWPRPWTRPRVPVVAWLSLCRVTDLSRGGWSAQGVMCSSQDNDLSRVTSWHREKFATVSTAPPRSTIDAGGDAATTTEILTIMDGTDVPVTLEAADVVARRWLVASQRMEGVIRINAGPMQEFRPPFPPEATPELKAKMTPPVLYRYSEIEITSDLPPPLQESDGWLSDSSFFIKEMSQTVAGRGNIKFQWKIKGVVYAL